MLPSSRFRSDSVRNRCTDRVDSRGCAYSSHVSRQRLPLSVRKILESTQRVTSIKAHDNQLGLCDFQKAGHAGCYWKFRIGGLAREDTTKLSTNSLVDFVVFWNFDFQQRVHSQRSFPRTLWEGVVVIVNYGFHAVFPTTETPWRIFWRFWTCDLLAGCHTTKLLAHLLGSWKERVSFFRRIRTRAERQGSHSLGFDARMARFPVDGLMSRV